MNRLLKRQIRRHFGAEEDIPQNMKPLLKAISDSYVHYEDDRLLLERAMEISSKELNVANAQIKEEAESQRQAILKLKSSIRTLSEVEGTKDVENAEDLDLLELSDLLQNQAKKIKEVESDLLLLQKFVDLSSDSIHVISQSGRFVFANEEACRRFRKTKEELKKCKLQEIERHFVENENAWDNLKSDLKNKQVISHETFNINDDGSSYPVEVVVQQIDIEHEPYYVAFARDISERKDAEEKQKELIQELKNFAYIVSHDLKAPLRAIGSITDWLTADHGHKLNDEGRSHLALLKKRVTRLHGLIEGILNYSRVGHSNDAITNVDLNVLVPNVLEAIIPEENFEININTKLPVVKGNQTRFDQIFQNLISNGIKYNDKKVGTIDISCVKNATNWQFCVKDNGPGIEEKYFEKIFQIFQTLNARDKVEGTGVGLSLVKKIINNYGGQIWLQSEVGKGSEFYFTIPIN